jgi:hypothetical protein
MQGMDIDFDNFEIDNEDFESEATKVEVGGQLCSYFK